MSDSAAETRRGGRRRAAIPGGRTRELRLRVSVEEFEAIAENAATTGLAVRAFVVRRALASLSAPGTTSHDELTAQVIVDYTRTLAELHRVGVNANQIAAGINRALAGGRPVTAGTAAEVVAAAAELPQLVTELREVGALVRDALVAVQRQYRRRR